MNSYQINVSGVPLTIYPLNDGTYKVCREKEVVAKLYPEITAVGIYWNGFEQISPMMAEQIGILINAHDV